MRKSTYHFVNGIGFAVIYPHRCVFKKAKNFFMYNENKVVNKDRIIGLLIRVLIKKYRNPHFDFQSSCFISTFHIGLYTYIFTHSHTTVEKKYHRLSQFGWIKRFM
jgi:hypothetical protein